MKFIFHRLFKRGRDHFSSRLSVVVCFCLVTGLSLLAQAGEFRVVEVRFVPDGDTIVLRSGEVVRLAGIDAPETAKKDTPGQWYAQKSRKRLAELVLGRTVTVSGDQPLLDVHGRTVGLVILPDSRWVNEILVAEGLAFVYPHKDGDKAVLDRLLLVQRQAINDGRGFWPVILELPQANTPWIGNENSKRFHRSDCKQVPVKTSKHWVRFNSLREAFEAGFSPSRECTTWPLE